MSNASLSFWFRSLSVSPNLDIWPVTSCHAQASIINFMFAYLEKSHISKWSWVLRLLCMSITCLISGFAWLFVSFFNLPAFTAFSGLRKISEISRPLVYLTCKDAPFVWETPEQEGLKLLHQRQRWYPSIVLVGEVLLLASGAWVNSWIGQDSYVMNSSSSMALALSLGHENGAHQADILPRTQDVFFMVSQLPLIFNLLVQCVLYSLFSRYRLALSMPGLTHL